MNPRESSSSSEDSVMEVEETKTKESESSTSESEVEEVNSPLCSSENTENNGEVEKEAEEAAEDFMRVLMQMFQQQPKTKEEQLAELRKKKEVEKPFVFNEVVIEIHLEFAKQMKLLSMFGGGEAVREAAPSIMAEHLRAIDRVKGLENKQEKLKSYLYRSPQFFNAEKNRAEKNNISKEEKIAESKEEKALSKARQAYIPAHLSLLNAVKEVGPFYLKELDKETQKSIKDKEENRLNEVKEEYINSHGMR